MLAVVAVRHESPGIDKSPRRIDRWQPVLGGEVNELRHARREGAARYDKERPGPVLRDPRKGRLDVVGALDLDRRQRQAKLPGIDFELILVRGVRDAGEGRVPED